MTASSIRGAAPLTQAQLTELSEELHDELRRLSPEGALQGEPLGERAQTRLLLILDALSRMRAGTYGVCIDCRGRIPYERLSVIPEATSCVSCGWSRQVERRVRA
jgi:RNA polymerase-binding transcription factor DksA